MYSYVRETRGRGGGGFGVRLSGCPWSCLGLSAAPGGRASGYALGTVLFGCVPVVRGGWRRAGSGAVELLGGRPLLSWDLLLCF